MADPEWEMIDHDADTHEATWKVDAPPSTPIRKALGHDGWALVCTLCQQEWSDATSLDVIELHYSIDHADHVDEDGKLKIELSTEWRGKGPEPLPDGPFGGSNRASRRRADRAKAKKPKPKKKRRK